MGFSRRKLSSSLCLILLANTGCDRKQQQKELQTRLSVNVVFVLIDALRADRLGEHDGKRSLTPVLDEIAADGVLFERATSQAPWTHPSVASIFTSRYPTVHGLGIRHIPAGGVKNAKAAVLSDRWQTLAETLQQAGCQTAGFVANPWMLKSNGFAQGFDHYDDEDATNQTNGASLNERIRQWLGRRTSQKPLFLYVHYMDVHGPYWAPEDLLEPLLKEVEELGHRHQLAVDQKNLGYLASATKSYKDQSRHLALADTKEYWIARYDAGVRYMDVHIGELRDTLRQAGLWENTLVIVTADHGEELLDHGRWNHGRSLFEEQLHVPLLMYWKGRLQPGRRIQDRVQLIDLMPTILELADLDPPDDCQGASLAGLLNGQRWDRPAYAEADKSGKKSAVYFQDLKMIRFAKRIGCKVYDLSKDPQERNPILLPNTPQGEQLAQAMDRLKAENEVLAEGHPVETVELSDKARERLKALGYTK